MKNKNLSILTRCVLIIKENALHLRLWEGNQTRLKFYLLVHISETTTVSCRVKHHFGEFLLECP